MYCRSILIILTSVVVTGFAGVAAAREQVQPIRIYDERNPAPDHIYFRHFLESLFDADSEERDSDAEIHEVLHGVGLSHSAGDEERARRMHRILRDRHMRISRDIRRAENRMLCDWRNGEWTEDEIFRQMDKLSVIRDRIAEKHYLDTLTMIDGKLAAALDLALQDGKTGFVSVRYPHKTMYDGAGLNVRDRVEALCRRKSF